MLLAVLYCEPNRIGAAALACDQTEHGDEYWQSIFAGQIQPGSISETAYIPVENQSLRNRLLQLGIDPELDGRELAQQLEAYLAPSYPLQRAA